MRFRFPALMSAALCFGLFIAPPLCAQYREYLISGKVVDVDGRPIGGVLLSLRDKASSRGYKFTTSKDGAFKFAGLPHGVYEVTIKKDGYVAKVDEWKFSTPQDRMQKVEIPPIILVSAVQVGQKQPAEKAPAGLTEETDKFNQGDYDGAIAGLTKRLGENPDDANALYLLGLCDLKKGLWPEAADAFNKVVALVPDYAGAYFQLGVLAKGRGEKDNALGFFTKASDLDPANPDVLYNVGLIHFEQNRAQDALNFFERALALRPNDPEILELAGRCHVNLGDFAKAIAYLEKAKQASTDPEKAKLLGEFIERLKELVKKSGAAFPAPLSP